VTTIAERLDVHSQRDVVSSEDLYGAVVYDRMGARLGEISTLLIDKASGRVVAVVLMVSGFLGLGHSHRQVPWPALQYDRSLNGFVVVHEPSGDEKGR
jgi:sporulation protein YlmC with PRC-barrel domain